jgi:hypothetical protein
MCHKLPRSVLTQWQQRGQSTVIEFACFPACDTPHNVTLCHLLPSQDCCSNESITRTPQLQILALSAKYLSYSATDNSWSL